MGKKTRKTRWRTLAIPADESDSEESNNAFSGSQIVKSYRHRPFYSKFTYSSSQSTPTRRFPYEPKSTRSSSTASDTKITFNEDEYTKITTPRQDVLFKKGYLSKPKNYQTQTSTGNSTASTGNSTGNGTPDHQSADGTEGTDLEYESQFVFPNAFVDQNGIYYINGYEHYPLVMYNPPICYPDYPVSRSKRHSTGSLTESTSPHNEETSHDLSQSGGENGGNTSEANSHAYNVIYPEYYFNGVCNPNAAINGQASTEPRKIKKKRRRKISTINQEDSATSSSDEEGYSSDEAITQVENRVSQNPTEDCKLETEVPEPSSVVENERTTPEETNAPQTTTSCPEGDQDDSRVPETNLEEETPVENDPTAGDLVKESKFNLDAKEFIPRVYTHLEAVPVDPNLQFVNVHPNFVPLSLINHPLNELNHPPFNPAFLPPGIPVNFVPADPKLLPNFVNYVPNFVPPSKAYEHPPNTPNHQPRLKEAVEDVEDTQKVAVEDTQKEDAEGVQNEKARVYKTEVDIAKIVSKLEEAAKEQKFNENRRQVHNGGPNRYAKNQRQRFNQSGEFKREDTYRQNSADKRRTRRYETSAKQNEDDTQRVVRKDAVVETKSEEIQTDPPPTITEEIKTESKETTPKLEVPSPRHQNFRSQNGPRRFINSYATRNAKIKTQENQMSRSIPARNPEYSETVKRQGNYSNSCPRYEKYTSSNRSPHPSVPKRTNRRIEEPSRQIPQTAPNQWISVSSKKKRKNKSTNEEEPEIELAEAPETIEQLRNPPETEESSYARVDAFIEIVVRNEASPARISTENDIPHTDLIAMQDVKDVEKEMLKESYKIQEETKETPSETKEPILSVKPTGKDAQKKKSKKGGGKNSAKRIIIVDPDVSKAEAKKITAKTPPTEEITSQETPLAAESDQTPLEISKTTQDEVLPPVVDQTVVENLVDAAAEKKKAAKKKKKTSKINNLSTSNIPSISSSSTTLNTAEDSYDFLLDTSALIEDKTNLEVSEELDKMIQKGLFGNLEEKFKSLNVSVDDEFFRSLSLKPKSQSTPDKGFIKAANFTTILNNSNPSLTKIREESRKIDVDFSKIKLPDYEPQPSTSRGGHFLDEIVENETGPPPAAAEQTQSSKSNGKLKNKSKRNVVLDNSNAGEYEYVEKGGVEEDVKESVDEVINEIIRAPEADGIMNGIQTSGDEEIDVIRETIDVKVEECAPAEEVVVPSTPNHEIAIRIEEPQENTSTSGQLLNLHLRESISPSETANSMELKPLYPITWAVKEWMSKTRETTPEIELLKSPDTIYKEFAVEEEDSDTEEIPFPKNCTLNPSARHCNGAINGRILEGRVEDDEMTISETWSMSQATSLQEDDLLDCWEPEVVDTRRREEEQPIEQGEDALEVKLETQTDEDKRTAFPRHGHLPYRAICCSLM